MQKFLTDVLEQMDLALEHISKRAVHDARFGLMLTDNAVELTLHEIAQHRHAEDFSRYMDEEAPYASDAKAALDGGFDAKLRFARLDGALNEEMAGTLRTMHTFRNQLYHLGIQHEEIIADLAEFHFVIACEVLADMKTLPIFWYRDTEIPARAKKYLSEAGSFSSTAPKQFREACRTMQSQCGYSRSRLVNSLADQMDRVIEEADDNLSIVANGVYPYRRQTRDEAIIEYQAWKMAFSEHGASEARKHGWSGGNRRELLDWLEINYPFKNRRDPIPGWRKQSLRFRSSANPHIALQNYISFMNSSSELRNAMAEAAAAAEAQIDRLEAQYRERMESD